MKKVKVKHSNTDVRKLHNLAYNGVFSRKTIDKIFDNKDDGFITFNSVGSYNKFKEFEFSSLAMLKNK